MMQLEELYVGSYPFKLLQICEHILDELTGLVTIKK